MKKLMCLVLLVCSFSVNAFVGEIHESVKGTTIRILPKTIKIVKGKISAVSESVDNGNNSLYLEIFSIKDCRVGYGIYQSFSLNSNDTFEQMVFLEGNSIISWVINDMCEWALQRTK